jgi:hypothetical protein
MSKTLHDQKQSSSSLFNERYLFSFDRRFAAKIDEPARNGAFFLILRQEYDERLQIQIHRTSENRAILTFSS